VNAIRALTGPPGAVARVAGPDVQGADVVFRLRGPSGIEIMRREVKSIAGQGMGSFNSQVAVAADQVLLGGNVLVQIPAGTNALQLVLRFRGARVPAGAAALGRYRSVSITLVDPSGAVLWHGPLVP
jgi:hypothetical protein